MLLRDSPESIGDKHACEAISAIVELLKSAGAKLLKDMVATKPSKWLWIYADYLTGLLTSNGYLDVACIPNVSERFCRQFKDWLARKCRKQIERSKEDLNAYGEEGRHLAREIKRFVGSAVEVDYGWTRVEDKIKGVWKVEWDRNISAKPS